MNDFLRWALDIIAGTVQVMIAVTIVLATVAAVIFIFALLGVTLVGFASFAGLL